jgi:hypothetical protein
VSLPSLSRAITSKRCVSPLCDRLRRAVAKVSHLLRGLKRRAGQDRGTARPAKDGIVQQHSGYINVDEKDGRTLFYYFMEATADAVKSPLILSLNGSIFFVSCIQQHTLGLSFLHKIIHNEILT